MKRNLLLLLLFYLAACNPTAPLTAVPPSHIVPTVKATVAASQPCYYIWASQELPDITTELQASIQAILPETTARAAAFGENCVAEDGSSTFSAMETDFYVTIPVAVLQDDEALGAAIEQVLGIVDKFLYPRVPGPNDGFVEFTFTRGSEQRVLRVPIQKGKDARAQGLHGAALLAALQAQ